MYSSDDQDNNVPSGIPDDQREKGSVKNPETPQASQTQNPSSGSVEGGGLENVAFSKGQDPGKEEGLSASQEEFVDAIYGVPVKVTAILGHARMSVQNLVKLGRGAVIQLSKRVGEPVDIMVNDRLVARGEVVLLDGTLGITLTELMKAEPF